MMPNTEAITLITHLNHIVRNHLTLVSQLFLHDLIFRQWGETAIHQLYHRRHALYAHSLYPEPDDGRRVAAALAS